MVLAKKGPKIVESRAQETECDHLVLLIGACSDLNVGKVSPKVCP